MYNNTANEMRVTWKHLRGELLSLSWSGDRTRGDETIFFRKCYKRYQFLVENSIFLRIFQKKSELLSSYTHRCFFWLYNGQVYSFDSNSKMSYSQVTITFQHLFKKIHMILYNFLIIDKVLLQSNYINIMIIIKFMLLLEIIEHPF